MTNTKNIGKARANATTVRASTSRNASAPSRPTIAGSAPKATAKSAPPATPPSAATPASTPTKPKAKLVRDSFTIPKSEYSVLEGLKVRATKLTRPAKKSELLRAGIAALNTMDDKAFLAALGGVPSLKTGRPKGSDASSAKAKK